MSTTIHVGKTRTATVIAYNAEGQQVALPVGVNVSWGEWQDGGNMSLAGHPTSANCHCYGVVAQGDYQPGRPVILYANITIPGYTTPVTIEETVNLAPVDNSPVRYDIVWGDEQ